jgi:peptide/nickel transport system permease protein
VPEPSEVPAGLGLGLGSSLSHAHRDLFPPVAETGSDGPGLAAGVRAKRSILSGLGWGFWVAVGICAVWILLAIFANLLPLKNPINGYDYSCALSGHMDAAHPLGCDPDGLDILSRVIYGSRVSLIVGFSSIAMGLVVGGVLGIIAGYFRGWIDRVLAVISNTFLAFPYLVLGLVIVSYIGRTLFDISLIIAVVAWPLLFRIVRASTIEYSQREYVLAAQALGSKPSRILRTLLLPDVVPSAITYGLVGVSLAIVAEGALSFIGQSVPAPTSTWGNMIAEGSVNWVQEPILLIVPSIALFSFILPINFIGDRLRGVLDSRRGVI